ncbi:hypothetical protein BGX26_002781, partial [Mortierella sp. AD094]
MTRLDPIKKQLILTDLKLGMATRAISLKHSVSQSKVSQLAQTVKKDIPPPQHGPPSKFTPSKRRLLVRKITTGDLNTA